MFFNTYIGKWSIKTPFPEDNEESGDNKTELRSSFHSHPAAKEKCCSDNFDKRASGQNIRAVKKGKLPSQPPRSDLVIFS